MLILQRPAAVPHVGVLPPCAGKRKLIEDCIKFLQDPRVTGSLEDHRIKYLQVGWTGPQSSHNYTQITSGFAHLQERMKLTDEEVEECFQGAYGHGTEMFEKAKKMKEEALTAKKKSGSAKKAKKSCVPMQHCRVVLLPPSRHNTP